MRISQSLLSNIVRQGAERATRALLQAQQPIADGTSLPAPSTDMRVADRATVLDNFERELGRFDHARTIVRNDLQSNELALAGIHDLVVEARDLAIQMASDTVSPKIRQDAASGAQLLLDKVANLANRSDAGGKHLFTGEAEGFPPLASDYRYQGNDAVRMVEVAPGVKVAATLSGREVFGDNNELVETLKELVTALATGDATQVAKTLDGLTAGRERVSATWGDVGERIALLDDLGDLTSNLRTNVKIERGTITDVDIASVAPAIQSAQTMLEAVLTTSRQLLSQVGAGWFK